MSTKMIVLSVLVVLMVCAAVTLFFVFRKIRTNMEITNERRTILSDGIAAIASIHSVRPTDASMDGRPGVRLEVTVTKDDGVQVPAVIDTYLPETVLASCQPGDTIQVKYLDGDPLRVEAIDAYVL